MKLQNFFVKTKMKELTKKHPSIWTNSNVYQLFFYYNNKEFEKYKKILFILYNEFLIEIENNIQNKELTFDLENLKEMKNYLQKDEEIDLRNKLDELEKNKIENNQNDKIDISTQSNNDDDINNNDNNNDDNKNKKSIIKNKNNNTEKKYINNLHDAELFTIDEIIKISDVKYYLEIFFGLGLVIFIFIIKSIFSASNKLIKTDFYKLKTLNENNILNEKILNEKILNEKILNEKILNSKFFETLFGNDIKNELKDFM